MASKRIGILKDGNDNQEDLPRASKRKGNSKDPPTSSSADTTMKRQHSCSHPSSSLGVCDVCEELLPEICGVPFEITQRCWEEFQPKMFFGFGLDRGNLCPTLSLLEYFPS